MLTGDKQISYEGFFPNKRGVCRARAYSTPNGGTTVIATEIDGNPGPSVTNAAEHVADAACREFGIVHPSDLMMIEHYRHGDEDTFDLVTLETEPASSGGMTVRFAHPAWRRLAPEEVENLTGEKFLTLTEHRDIGSVVDDVIGEIDREGLEDGEDIFEEEEP